MDGKTRDLRDRIKSIKNTRRITEAMRLVAAARVRRAQEAVLKTRPLISQLQMVMQPYRKIFDVIIVDLFRKSIVLMSICHHATQFQVFKTVLEACKSEEVELPILEVREVKKVSLVVVTGDRGLCGGYNSQIIKQATKRIAKLESQGIAVRQQN